MKITVWNEFVHEKTEDAVKQVHPQGIHNTLAGFLQQLPGAQVRTATLEEPLTDALLQDTDVLLWWGHMAHEQVPDELAAKVQARVLAGMGLIVLHSGHHSKVFRLLMGTSCDLRWREGAYERLFCINPAHPIAEGVPDHFELGGEECYGEFFDIPEPEELIFGAWFDCGEIFRAGCTWRRGFGKIFYFQPGHETNHSFHHPTVRRILQNACRWAAPTAWRTIEGAPPIVPSLEEARAGKQ
jgi:trehalose utilization protein